MIGALFTTVPDNPAWFPTGWALLILAGWFGTYGWHTITVIAGSSARHAGLDFEVQVTESLRSALDDSWTLTTNFVCLIGSPDLDIVVSGHGRSVAFEVKWSNRSRNRWHRRTLENTDRIRLRHDLHRLGAGTTELVPKLVIIRNGRAELPTESRDGIHVLTVDQVIDRFIEIQQRPRPEVAWWS